MSKSKKDIEEENKRINNALLNAGGKYSGYEFQKDTIANQMAYLFGGKKGEEKAKKIIEEANKNYPSDLQLTERRKYIEDQVRKRGEEVNSDFQKGFATAFKNLNEKNLTSDCKGDNAEKTFMLDLMQSLGLNVDKDNVQTHYSPGPPMVMQVTWVNRPTENLADENSNVNKLAKLYSDNLDQKSKKEFTDGWKEHVQNAKDGGPKIDKEKFLADADKSFSETKTKVNTSQSVSNEEILEQVEDSTGLRLK